MEKLVETIHSLVKKNSITNIIKIDFEGFELNIISGAKKALLNKKSLK